MPVQGHQIPALYHLTNDALVEEAELRAGQERRATARIVAVLAELEARKAYLDLGFSSLHAFCMGQLKFSKHAAYRRMKAADVAGRFPVVLDHLAEGNLNLSTIVVLAPHLSVDNYRQLIEAAVGKSTSEVRALVAALRPGTVPDQVTLTISISPEAFQQLECLQELMRHTIADGDVSKILEKAIALQLAHVEKQQFAKVEHPRSQPEGNPQSRRPSAHVRREAAERDGHQCTFVGKDGKRCPATTMLQYGHDVPAAAGGQATLENIHLVCAAHNRRDAETFSLGRWTATAKQRMARASDSRRASAKTSTAKARARPQT